MFRSSVCLGVCLLLACGTLPVTAEQSAASTSVPAVVVYYGCVNNSPVPFVSSARAPSASQLNTKSTGISWDRKAHKDRKGSKDHKGHRDRKDHRDLRECPKGASIYSRQDFIQS